MNHCPAYPCVVPPFARERERDDALARRLLVVTQQ